MSTRPSRFRERYASSRVSLSFLCVLLCSHAGLSASQSYRVRLTLAPPLRATVDGTVFVRDGVLRTGAGGADNLPRRWGTFVTDLHALDAAGTVVPISEHQSPDSYAGEWRTGERYTGLLKISYVVDLAYTQKPWPPSNEKAGTFDGKAIYLVTKPLFLGSLEDGPSRVSFELPDGARLVTPWDAIQGQPNTFDVPTMRDLQRNTIVAGDFAADEIKAGPFTLRLALLGELRGSFDEASRALRAFALRYVRIFPQTPKSAYLLTIFAADDEDGEAFEGSAAFVTRAPLTREGTIMWGNTQGHELFHLWCGRADPRVRRGRLGVVPGGVHGVLRESHARPRGTHLFGSLRQEDGEHAREVPLLPHGAPVQRGLASRRRQNARRAGASASTTEAGPRPSRST